MELTRRQKEFLYTLLDLYREEQGPFYYSQLAQRLQISRFTAYDMLRLLEYKGVVVSSYQLSETKSGPVRSEIVFTPTDKAHCLISELTGDIGDDDWSLVKERALKRIQNGDIGDRGLALEMFAHLPPDRPEIIRYCTELIYAWHRVGQCQALNRGSLTNQRGWPTISQNTCANAVGH